MIIVFVNVLKTLLFGLFVAVAGIFLTWHSFKMHYAGVVITVHVIVACVGLLLVFLALRIADRALRMLIR